MDGVRDKVSNRQCDAHSIILFFSLFSPWKKTKYFWNTLYKSYPLSMYFVNNICLPLLRKTDLSKRGQIWILTRAQSILYNYTTILGNQLSGAGLFLNKEKERDRETEGQREIERESERNKKR